MGKPKFSLAKYKDPESVGLINETDHKTLAVWAIDCAERVMPYFEEAYPDDHRPRRALQTLREWIATGKFSIAAIRKASLDSHAAAKEIGNENSAASAAHAAGQAVAIAHVPLHALGAANYALQALHRASGPADTTEIIAAERDWQIQHLLNLRKQS